MMNSDEKSEITDGLRRWALWSFKCLGVDLEPIVSPETLDKCIKAWDFYTSKGLDFGSAAARTLSDLSEVLSAAATPPTDGDR